MRHVGLFVIVFFGFLPRGDARVNPLRVLLDQLVRPEIIIVFDTSGSMNSPASGSGSGSDCGGHRPTVDLCGDGMCTGTETTGATSCSADCNLTNPLNPQSSSISVAGQARSCNTSSTSAVASRMFVTKRVVRSILPKLRSAASFGLVAFDQVNYYRYYKADTSGTTKKVSIYLSEEEMRGLGAWDTTNLRPKTTFTRGGTTFTLLSSAGLTITADSLYARIDNSTVEARSSWSTGGRRFTSGGYVWSYLGSFYTYNQYPIKTGDYYGDPVYKGPQFNDGTYTWVHNRAYYSPSPITASYPYRGRLVMGISPSENQGDQDGVLREIISRFNYGANGGFIATGNTPTGPAIGVAHQMFIHRQEGHCGDNTVSLMSNYNFTSTTMTYPGGVCPYVNPSTGAAQPDPMAVCRPRFAIVLTDGDWNAGIGGDLAARNMYNETKFSGNPVRTLVVGIPGLGDASKQRLNRMADYGADGLLNNDSTCCCVSPGCVNNCTPDKICQSAYFADNETELVTALWNALFDAIRGDYTTSQAGIATSGASYLPGDVALVSSTEFPGWRGHMRAWDLIQDPPRELWDAGEMLSDVNQDYKLRKLYTGYPGSLAQNAPVPLFSDTSGTVNTSQILSVWGSIAPTPSVTPTTTDIEAMVEWLAGKTRSWRLDPIINSTPANVGPPPSYQVGTHSDFESTYLNRERLIYVASNDGFLHAFRAKDGTEAFAYLPPNLWPKVYELWKLGGQDMDPNQFKWVFASSPRVEDVPTSGNNWQTQMVLTMGPGGHAFVVLDVSNPSDCNQSPCALNNPPFRVRELLTQLDVAQLGETWSIPAVFFAMQGSNVKGMAAMGSGYGATGTSQGRYYFSLDTLWTSSPDLRMHEGSTAKVDYAVFAPTVAAIDADNNRKIVATYQADLKGRIYRYPEGDADPPNFGTRIVDMVSGYTYSTNPSSTTTPFYFGPAVYYRGAGKATLAAASGTITEENPPSPADISVLFMRTETNGTVSPTDDRFSCPVNEICTTSTYCFSSVPSSCTAPLPTSLPVSSPLLMDNTLSSQMEAFFIMYEPSPSKCVLGNTWLLRTSTVTGTTTQPRLVTADKKVGVYATGVAIAGGGRAIFLTESGKGANKASVTKALGSMGSSGTISNAPMIESWREVK